MGLYILFVVVILCFTHLFELVFRQYVRVRDTYMLVLLMAIALVGNYLLIFDIGKDNMKLECPCALFRLNYLKILIA